MILPKFPDVENAKKLITPYINTTPVLKSSGINQIAGCRIFFKCENFQKVGAFKYRGATNAVLNLTESEKARGVATHSSGNHAQALALAGKTHNIKATIVMPINSKSVKKNAVVGYGAEVVMCEPTLQSRESTLSKVIEKTGAVEIHPYNNFNVIAGQGTAALELLETEKDFDYIIAPVGGGGLLSGTSLSVKGISPTTKVIAAEPAGANDAFKSFNAGYIIPSVEPNTIADGLLTSLGEINFEIIKANVDKIICVTDEQIIEAMRLVWERMKIIIEPSSATTLAVVLSNKEMFENMKVGLIISGGNVDLGDLPF